MYMYIHVMSAVCTSVVINLYLQTVLQADITIIPPPPPPPPAEHPDSVAEHMVGVHSPEYDHEAFLGKAEAERFDQLPPEEAKRRLG